MSDRIDDLIISSLSGIGMHLSCRAISRRIEKIYGIRLSPQLISAHISLHIDADATSTKVRKYRLDKPADEHILKLSPLVEKRESWGEAEAIDR